MKYDYLIVGAGLFGSVFAQQCKEAGKSCLVIDKRDHIAGNIYSEKVEGIEVHKYGPHIFQTNNDAVWEYVNKFSKFRQYAHKVKVNYYGSIYSFPINLDTLYAVYGVTNPEDAQKKLNEVRVKIDSPKNLEEHCLAMIGPKLYEIFIRGYTEKQWGKDPRELPASIIKRIPVRLTYDDRYHEKKYSGIPLDGYTQMVANMLDGVKVELGVDFTSMDWKKFTKTLVYSGKIESLFGSCYGELDYRSLRFETKTLAGDFQGVAQMNYTASDVPFTRITEHKHFNPKNQEKTVVTWEYPEMNGDPYYPINDEKNNALYKKYKALIGPNIIGGGRLFDYCYYDMDQAIASALKAALVIKPGIAP